MRRKKRQNTVAFFSPRSIDPEEITCTMMTVVIPSFQASTRLFYSLWSRCDKTILLNRLQRMFKEKWKKNVPALAKAIAQNLPPPPPPQCSLRWKQSYSVDHITDVRVVRIYVSRVTKGRRAEPWTRWFRFLSTDFARKGKFSRSL